MKLNLDVIDPVDLIPAVNAALMVIQQNPNQEFGNRGAIKLQMSGKNFTVVRNQDSYTARQG
jgi:hypothetical protein